MKINPCGIVILVICCTIGVDAFSNEKLNLQSNWTLTNSNFNISINNIQVPTSIHSVLHQRNLIDDPLYRFNDIKYRYLVNDNHWVFQNYFELSNQQLNVYQSKSLIFESIDTVSSIYLNGELILETNNQFLKYESKNLDGKLQKINLLQIKFLSPIKQAEYLSKQYPYRVPPECPPSVQHGECHVNFLRKQQCSFSWDWGPAFAPIGINAPVYLTLINSFNFDFYVSVYPGDRDLTKWLANIDINITQTDFSKKALILVKIENLDFAFKKEIELNPNDTLANLNLTISNDKIQLWWPNGYGDQILYNLKIKVIINDKSIVKEKTIGFRSVELIQEKVPSKKLEHGYSFYFKINNLDILLKGSNWIPVDSFKENINLDNLKSLLNSAKIANMNVLRVWGGGSYEQEEFYQLANQFGLMIWQDFMFACGTYPTNDDFLDNVKSEVEYQVNRLKNHPCIIVWAGNNENEAALSTNWYDTDSNKDLYEKDYRKLYIETIMQVVSKFDPEASRPFLSSSPTNGIETVKENWISKNPYDLKNGDLHFYDYKMNGWDPSLFPIPRLMSEFGVQSLPSLLTLSKGYSHESGDFDMFSELNQHRQHHEYGNEQILEEIGLNLNIPDGKDKTKNFGSVVYLSQINQAMFLRTGSELFRRSRNYFDFQTGLGLCMGTMYWQFNDIWQAPSWSSVEYGGRWKMALYFVKNSYSNLLLSPVLNGSRIDIYAISDLRDEVESEFELLIYSYDSLDVKYNQSVDFKIEALTSRSIFSISLDQIEAKTGCSIKSNQSCILMLSSSDTKFENRDSINFLLFKNRLAHVDNLKVPNLRVERVKKLNHEGIFSIELETDSVSLFVWFSLNTDQFDGLFSDNGFHMVKNQKLVLFKTGFLNVTESDVSKYLTVQSLLNPFV